MFDISVRHPKEVEEVVRYKMLNISIIYLIFETIGYLGQVELLYLEKGHFFSIFYSDICMIFAPIPGTAHVCMPIPKGQWFFFFFASKKHNN